MAGQETRVGQGIGETMLDSLSLPEKTSHILFLALLVTAVGGFVAQNVLMHDVNVLKQSAPVFGACMAVLFVFYALLRGLGSIPWALVLTYGLLCVVTFSRAHWAIVMLYLISAVGVIRAIRFIRIGWWDALAIAFMGGSSALAILGCEQVYTSFDEVQRMAAGAGNPDTLFHASIAAMPKNYGVVSNGLNGLIVTPYHALSHVFMAAISDLSWSPVLEVYGVAPWVLFAPLVIFAIVTCSLMLDEARRADVRLAWGFVSLVLVVAPDVLLPLGFFWSYFVSESYMVSVPLFVLGMPVLFKRILTSTDLVLVTLFGLAIGASKGSVGVMYAGLWFLRVLFPVARRNGHVFAAFALVSIATAVVVAQSAVAHMPHQRMFFGFIRVFSLGGQDITDLLGQLEQRHWGTRQLWWNASLALGTFFVGHFFFSWVLAFWLGCRRGDRRLFETPGFVYTIGLVAAASLIVAFVYIGGDIYYFSSVPLFFALPMLTAVFASWSGWRTGRGEWPVWLLLLLIFAFLLQASHNAALGKRSAHKIYVQKHNLFMDELAEAREHTALNVVLHPNADFKPQASLVPCWAEPFAYPAISERPWVGVITPRQDCLYADYSYIEYGVTPTHQSVGVEARILPGMQQMAWPPASLAK